MQLHKVIELEVWPIPIPIHPRPRPRLAIPWSRQGHGSISVLPPRFSRMSLSAMPLRAGVRIRVVVVSVPEVGRMQSALMPCIVSRSTMLSPLTNDQSLK